MSRQHRGSLIKSFGYAFSGIGTCIRDERNIKIHLTVTAMVVLCGFFFRISAWEWCVCLTLFGLVLALELVNTAVEAVVDLVTEERKPLARKAKDTAAWAVLIAAISAAAAGLIIFLPKGLAFWRASERDKGRRISDRRIPAGRKRDLPHDRALARKGVCYGR